MELCQRLAKVCCADSSIIGVALFIRRCRRCAQIGYSFHCRVFNENNPRQIQNDGNCPNGAKCDSPGWHPGEISA